MQVSSSRAEYNDSEDVRFAAILTGKEEVPEIDTYDTGLAVFQPKGSNNNNLKFSIKIAGMDKIKKACLHIGKPHEDGMLLPNCINLKLLKMKL